MDRTAEQQALFEHELLSHIASALRTTIDWAQRTPDFSRRLPSLRFIAHSFYRHLEHILALEEREGFLPAVRQAAGPETASLVENLRREHEQFRRSLRNCLDCLERVTPADYLTLGEICHSLLGLLEQINAHNEREMLLVEELRELDGRFGLL